MALERRFTGSAIQIPHFDRVVVAPREHSVCSLLNCDGTDATVMATQRVDTADIRWAEERRARGELLVTVWQLILFLA